MYKNYKYLVLITVFFSILVVGLGAYTRLSDAGLGCPDWPGCYGFLTVPKHETALLHVEQNYPDMMFEAAKAWKEMIHRYFAGALGLLILALFVFAWLKRQYPNTPVKLPLALLLLVIFQAALGMWTVTMNLQPLVVMGHLLGGFSILSLLFLLYLRLTTKPIAGGDAGARPFYRLALVGLVVLVLQIALGGWLAANYAAPHCNGLPLCSYGQPFSLKSVFQLPLEHSTYEYGVLSQQARMSIHLLHRIWALVTCVVLALIMWRIYSQSFSRKIKHCTVTVLVALLCQICLGLAVVHWHFPLSVALAHNLMAALLLLSMVRLCFHLKARTQEAIMAILLSTEKSLISQSTERLKDYLAISKFKVVAMLVLTAWVGLALAPDMGRGLFVQLASLLGIGLLSAAAAVINHVVDSEIDSKMARTRHRPVAKGRLSKQHALSFAAIIGSLGFTMLIVWANTLTAVLTLFALVGYAFIYTSFLKRATPQNIVIGGLAGAMPPLLGWVSETGHMAAAPWLLVMIIFTWTPPHFWALAIARKSDYERAKIPMLPVTHGIEFCKTCVVAYSILLALVCVLPYLIGMSGVIYLLAACGLNTVFIYKALKLKIAPKDDTAMDLFRFSIVHLMLLFIALFIDKWLVL